MTEGTAPLRLPVQGRERVAVLAGVRRALADDTAVQVDRMVAGGWDLPAALDAVDHVWRPVLHAHVDQLLDEVITVRRWAA